MADLKAQLDRIEVETLAKNEHVYVLTYWRVRRTKDPEHWCIVMRGMGPLRAVQKLMTLWRKRPDTDHKDAIYVRARRLSGDHDSKVPDCRYYIARAWTVKPLGSNCEPPPGAPEEWTARWKP